jgi:hypothetical protein
MLLNLLMWVAANLDSWIRRDMGAEVFQEVAGRYGDDVVALLAKALRTDDLSVVKAIAAVVRKAHRTFIWDEPDFVRLALQSAGRLGEGARREMVGALYGSAISGVRSGTPGQPYPEDIEQRDRSLALADKMPRGSAEEAFYRDLAKSADKSIRMDADDDLADDGRFW